MTTQAVAKDNRKKPRLIAPEAMEPKDKEAFDKLPDAKKEEYAGRLAMQSAQDQIHTARRKGAADREAKTLANKKEAGIKAIIKDVRDGSLEGTIEAVTPRFEAMEPPLPTEEYEATFERIKTDSVSRSKQAAIPAKPAYELTHKLIKVLKEELVAPDFTTTPDSTQSNSVRRYGMILPLLVRADPTEGSDKYRIMDGKRRYFLLPDNQEFEVLLVSGFPDEDTAERAEVTVNRVRSLNVLSVANTLDRMHVRGITDTEIRRDMGFKTGEIDKLTSIVTNLDGTLSKALTEGNITPSVALSIAKLPKELQATLAKTYLERVKANPSLARISESDVEGIRQVRASDSAKRDTPTLAGLAGSVDEKDAKGGGVDKTTAANVDSKTAATSSKGAKK